MALVHRIPWLALAVFLSGCSIVGGPTCGPIELTTCTPSSEAKDPAYSCVDRWICKTPALPDSVYEVRCTDTADGQRHCQCFHDNHAERELSGGPWCHSGGSPDSYERMQDANWDCGWSMPTCNV